MACSSELTFAESACYLAAAAEEALLLVRKSTPEISLAAICIPPCIVYCRRLPVCDPHHTQKQQTHEHKESPHWRLTTENLTNLCGDRLFGAGCKALEWARSFADALGAKQVLLHVIDIFSLAETDLLQSHVTV